MSRIRIDTWFNFKRMSSQQAVTLVFVASVLLVVVSYGIWQFGRLLSPQGSFNTGGNPTVLLSITDYYKEGNNYFPLPNSLSDTRPPWFEESQTKPTELTFGSNGRLDMARLEIRMDYR